MFAYRPARNLWYRAAFAGGPGLAASGSNVLRVVVRQLAPLRPTNGGRPKFVEGGTPSATVRFTTTVRPSRPELPRAIVRYVVYELFGDAWRLVAARDIPVDANGLASTVVTFTSPTRWYVRSQALPTTANANSVWSPVELYFVGFPGQRHGAVARPGEASCRAEVREYRGPLGHCSGLHGGVRCRGRHVPDVQISRVRSHR